MTVANRLKEYCTTHRITQDSLVNKGFGSKQTINNYINGKTEPKANFLEKFLLEFRLSATWLMTGEGDPLNPSHKNDHCSEYTELTEKIDELKTKLTEIQEKYTKCLEDMLDKKEKDVTRSAS